MSLRLLHRFAWRNYTNQNNSKWPFLLHRKMFSIPFRVGAVFLVNRHLKSIVHSHRSSCYTFFNMKKKMPTTKLDSLQPFFEMYYSMKVIARFRCWFCICLLSLSLCNFWYILLLLESNTFSAEQHNCVTFISLVMLRTQWKWVKICMRASINQKSKGKLRTAHKPTIFIFVF